MKPDIAEVVARLDAAEFDAPCGSETVFKRRWQRTAAALDDFPAAFQGGVIADRLSWVFVSAYQSAVRACFPGVPRNGYASFAVTEDATGEHPGTRLTGSGRLNGCKSWIASSRVVDQLIVTIGPTLDSDPVAVPVGPGVLLSHREKPAFLGDMSQGYARFDNAEAGSVGAHRARSFALAEAFFVMVAGAGYLLREARRLDQAELAKNVRDLLPDLERQSERGFDFDVDGLLSLNERTSSLGKACSSAAQVSADERAVDWQTNGRLLGMYGRALRRRR